MKRHYILLAIIIGLLQFMTVTAQDDSTLIITGSVIVIDENTIQVGGISVNIAEITDIVFEDGMIVTVTGILQGTIITPITIVVEPDPVETPAGTPELTPVPTLEMTPSPEATSESDDLGITIVIEGPVQSITVNVINIYGIEIELDAQDIRTNVIQVGDVLRIRGHHRHAERGPIVVVAVSYIFINVDVIVIDGQLWRDYGDCAVLPPVWADGLALHWHNRCDVIIVPVVPAGCRVTGMGGVKCSNRRS